MIARNQLTAILGLAASATLLACNREKSSEKGMQVPAEQQKQGATTPRLPLDSLEKIGRFVLDGQRFAERATPITATSKPRRCEGDDPTKPHTSLCLLELSLLDAGETFDQGNPPKIPVAVATIKVLGTKTEGYLGLEPLKVYAWVIIPGTPQLSGFVNIADARDWRPINSMQQLRMCHSGKPHGNNKVDFYCCDSLCPKDPMEKASSGRDSNGRGVPVMEHTSPPWFSCAIGCCYADF